MDPTYLILLLLMLFLSAFFSGVEIGYLSANKFKIALSERQGDQIGKITNKFLQNSSRFITTILIGNNLALVLYGISFSRLLEPVLQANFGWTPTADSLKILAFQTAISTIIVLLFGEYLPKALYRSNPDRMLRISAYFMNLFYYTLKPFVHAAEHVSRFLLRRVLRVSEEEGGGGFSKRDLYNYVSTGLTSSENAEQLELDAEIFKNAMDFNETRVREFMVPRTELEAMPQNSTLKEVLDKFIETELSRILIFDETLDYVKGYVHTSAMFKNPNSLQEIIQSLMVVPETMSANILLHEFNQNRKSVALVVDEFGGTAGMVTIEDLVEVVFGDIEDEHDIDKEEELTAQQIDDNTFLFSARLEVDETNHEFGLHLPEEGEYTTLGGLVMHYAERIPRPKETLQIGPYLITIQKASHNKVEILRLERLTQVPESEEAASSQEEPH